MILTLQLRNFQNIQDMDTWASHADTYLKYVLHVINIVKQLLYHVF